MENFNCPQFVDFTSPEAFELNDGADFFFEKGVVGQIDLGLDNDMFKVAKKDEEEEEDKVQALVDQLKSKDSNFNSTKTKIPFANNSNNNNNNKPIENETEQMSNNKEEKTPTLPECVTQYKSNKIDKENQIVQTTSNNKSKVVGVQKFDSCNTTFTIKTPTATKPSLATENSADMTTPCMHTGINPNMMSKQDSVENANSANSIKYQTPTSNGPSSSSIPKQTNFNSTTPHIVENKKNNILINSSNQSNIVKKTLAKMTAAFKQRNNNDNLIFKANKLDMKKQKPANEPIRVENHIKRKNSNEMFRNQILSPESDHGSSNRRASSVPRTLREKQALSKAGIVVLEHIEDNKPTKHVTKDDSATVKVKQSEMKNQKTKVAPPTSIITLASAKKKQPRKQQNLEERRRSRSCNESISNLRTHRHTRRSTNEESIDTNQTSKATEIVKTKISASPMPNQLKPRAKSGERAPLLPMYSGVKFVPKINSHKYTNLDGANFTQNQHTSILSTLPLEDVLKQRPVCMQKRSTPTIASAGIKIDLSKKTTLLANRSINNTIKSSSFKCKVNSTNTSIVNVKPVNVSLVKPSSSDYHLSNTQNNNISVSSSSALDSSRLRKKSDNNNKQASNGFLHTELRALKRQEYEQSMKEKEKMAIQMKHDLDSERLKKQQEEIQKIRIQRTFRSQPIKHYKPIELKPSEKPLTDPKSPNLTGNHHNSKLSNMSTASKKNDSFGIQSFNALVDAPLTNKSTTNSNLFRSNSLLRNQRNFAVSHDDIRFGN